MRLAVAEARGTHEALDDGNWFCWLANIGALPLRGRRGRSWLQEIRGLLAAASPAGETAGGALLPDDLLAIATGSRGGGAKTLPRSGGARARASGALIAPGRALV
jgi:hypothetical protein